MILTCPKCSTRLQLETTKLPTRAFSIKCPKCQNMLSVSPPEMPGSESEVAPAASPAAPRTAPLAQAAPAAEDKPSLSDSKLPCLPADLSAGTAAPELDPLKALTAMLASALAQTGKPSGNMGESRRRRVLACLSVAEELQKVQTFLQGHEYDLIFGETSEQAIEMLQLSNQVDIVLLDANFEEDHQGSTAILRFISSLTPSHRRRLFVALTAPGYKTLDTQTAFANGVNLLINSGELSMLPLALNKGIREFNLLYRSFNEASNLNPF
jgi:predicted Zn finger-like uncharacterized protein